MSCPICSGRAFVSEEKPYRIVPCYHCGSRPMFIYPGDEERFIRGVVEVRSQKSFDFPTQEKR
jgi:hypothetical protein